jgi:ferric-dicitrate binding protein FerR (iron transport regulator)
MQKNKKMNETLLIQFLTHRCTPSELRQVDEWVAADKANAHWLFEMESIWSLKNEIRFSDKQEIEEAYNRFLSRITEKEQVNRGNKRKLFVWNTFRRYAAVIAFAVTLSSALFFLTKRETTENQTITVEAPNGRRVSLTLSDGTKVWLNSQSVLTYPTSFSTGSREVNLSGEGFFEVASDAQSPFIVHSSLLNVKVLGTKFDLKAYPEETSLVTLAEGKVEVATSDETQRVILTPDLQVTCSKKNGLGVPVKVNAELTRLWVNGDLCFVNQPLSKIAADLERWFDVRIRISDPNLATDSFTCRFEGSVTLEQILSFLKETKQLNYSIKEKEIVITKY